jgi:hypothetical protein
MAAKPGGAAPAPAAPPAPRAKAAGGDAPTGNVSGERLSFVAKALLGCTVEVTVRFPPARGLGLICRLAPRYRATPPGRAARSRWRGAGAVAARGAHERAR